jgi:hypothetical protein
MGFSSRHRVGLGSCSAAPARAPTPSLCSGPRSDSLAELARFVLACLTFVALSLGSPNASAAEVCDAGVCVSGAEWTSGDQLDDKARAREAKRNRKGKDATLTVELTSGRGSVFLDGVWIAIAPLSSIPLKPGKHDLEVRDGEEIVARGVLEIGKKGGDVTVRIGQ